MITIKMRFSSSKQNRRILLNRYFYSSASEIHKTIKISELDIFWSTLLMSLIISNNDNWFVFYWFRPEQQSPSSSSIFIIFLQFKSQNPQKIKCPDAPSNMLFLKTFSFFFVCTGVKLQLKLTDSLEASKDLIQTKLGDGRNGRSLGRGRGLMDGRRRTQKYSQVILE